MHRPWLVSLAALLLLLLLPPSPGHAGKLADDGRAGVVLDVQGTALVRPAGRMRWTPLGPKSVLFPGDLVRTRARGAHALELALTHGRILVGPGVELQVTADGTPRLLRGEAEVIGTPEAPFAVQGAGDFQLASKGTAWLRAGDRRTTQLEETPRWVQGYRDSASDEWMGSLLAKVDGRDVPLAVGYHKVDVEVRDQIARTTVEQSFVNGTKDRLEGVFYFPLPADASISGFGMWIGGELVEADIVERTRARQIYEDILRRKKDPGLLEWEGGNIFKARVFPIEPHSEKRIRIRYTQVLPLEGDTYRYRYALRSELLRTKPLRELQLAVRIVSTQPMASVRSPTHEVTLHETGHEATAEFRASEYRPSKDFELAVKVERTKAITAIPHRRGEDGYFMLMVAPPAPESAAWERELSPEGAPLDVLLLADTSGSMGAAARENQAAFLEGLLALLGSKDRFRLAAFDADVSWIVGDPTAPDDETIRTALDTLAARRSLGWTDLDAGMKAALAAAGEDTLVVYVGDGVSTTGDADAAATADRMRQLGKASEASVHAVAASSSFEAGVLQALAETGGGSVRTLGAHPTIDAYTLLSEAARPSVKDLSVRIEGIRTARVYPERLPNLPLGAQQVVLGRFLPSHEPQEGRVTVEGVLAGKSVRYTSTVTIPAADAGNSFLPRLWGRKHIDALLAQGGPEVNEELIAFSERFGIMTPLTSFLVLESDEDRERYGVQRRVRMRDGERFFADAKDRAMLEQRRDLMRQAGRWRLGLRRDALLEIARLGRDLPIQVAPPPASLEVALAEDTGLTADTASGFGFTSFGQTAFADKDGDTFFTESTTRLADRGLDRAKVLEAENINLRQGLELAERQMDPGIAAPTTWGDAMDGAADFQEEEGMARTADRGRRRHRGAAPTGGMPPPAESPAPMPRSASKGEARAPAELEAGPTTPPGDLDDMLEEVAVDEAVSREQGFFGLGGGAGGRYDARRSYAGKRANWAGRPEQTYRAPQYGFTLQSLGFPAVPTPPRDEGGEGTPDWPEDVHALLRGLSRRAALRAVPHGVHLVLERESLHPTRETASGGRRVEAWIGADAWLVQRRSVGFAEPLAQWSHDGTRGIVAQARRLARTRAATPRDADAWWLPVWDLRVRDVLRAWARAGYRPQIVGTEAGLTTVALVHAHPEAVRIRLVIDSAKRVVTESRWVDAQGRTLARLARSDFFEAAGRWWARTTERFDAEDRRTERRVLRVTALAEGALAKQLAEASAARADVLAVHGPLPSRPEAKDAVRAKRAGFRDHLVLCVSLGQQQRADESLAAWARAEALAEGKPGRAWVRTVLLDRARHGEAFQQWLGARVPFVDAAGAARGRFLAAWLLGFAQRSFGNREYAALLDALRGAWVDEDSPQARLRELAWQQRRIAVHDRLQETETARALRAALATAWPHRVDVQLAYTADLWNVGRDVQAVAALEHLLEAREPWTREERAAIYLRLTDRLWERRDLERLHDRLGDWLDTHPHLPSAWQRWFSSILFLGKEAEGDARVQDALATTLADEDPRWHEARLRGALWLATGDGWNFHVGHIHEPLLEPLVAAILYDVRRASKRAAVASSALNDWRFRRTDAHRRVREAFVADLQADGAVATMPLHKLARYISILSWHDGGVPDAVWSAVLESLTARWTAEAVDDERRRLEAWILQLLDNRGKREDALAFVETAYARSRADAAGADAERARLARAVFDRLLQTPDRDPALDDARESRVIELLPAILAPTLTDDERRAAAARDVRTAVDRLYRWRLAAGLGSPESRKELTRAQLKVLRKEVRTRVRGELAARLGAAEKALAGLHAEWLQLERLGYAVEHGEDLPALVAEATAILTKDWPRPDPDVDLRPLDRLARERAAVVLAYAATRRNASADVRDGVLATFAAGEAAEPQAATARDASRALLDWRYQSWRLLLALDDAPRLETALRGWVVPAKVESRWRVGLGYLLAETGRVADAAEQFEAVRALDELDVAAYAVLADWYLVLGDDAARDRSILARYEHMNEGQLSTLVWQHESRAQQRPGGVPADFDPESVRVLRALMRKASYPGNYWYRIRNLYRGTKDHRLLEPVGQGLVGHTKEAGYGFLAQVARLANEVHEEATLDAWNAGLATLLAKADSALDRRMLQLAIAQVEGRAGRVPEADADHGTRSLAAMKAAFENDWQPGEPELMASYLRNLGKVSEPAVRDEQLRQLAALRARAKEGTLERLRIASAEAQTLWLHARHDAAIDLIEAELALVAAEHDGRVPLAAVRIWDQHVNWLSNRARFAEAERVILREFDRWDLPMRRRGLRNRLHLLYVETLRRGGRVSIGRGTALFEATRGLLLEAMQAEPIHLGTPLSTFCNLHRQANKLDQPRDAHERLETWAADAMPALLTRVPLAAANHVGTVASTVRDLSGPERGLGVLLARVDAEPSWLTRIGSTVWHRHPYSFARWRHEASGIGSLAPRLQVLVVRQLEQNLLRGNGHASWFYNRRHKFAWHEKFDLFADTTERVAELHGTSEAIVVRCAHMLRSNLGRGRPALDMLAAANERGLLGEGNRWTLANWLESDGLHERALVVTDALIAARPQNLGYRMHRVTVLAALGRKDDAKAELEGSAAAWAGRKQWSESVAATLGGAAAKHGFPALAERWMEEAIRLRQEARGHRGGRDSRLGGYYRSLALARAKLGKAEAAVQAASTALLMANPRRQKEMRDAGEGLLEALRSLPSLAGYVETYDAEVARSGLDAPVLRKAFAALHHERKDHAAEIVQLLLARELDAGDADVHKRLVAAYDAAGDARGAVDALFGSITLNPYDHDAYEALATRFAQAGDSAGAERARTTLAEIAPHQPGGHRALATIREGQKRWSDAVVQWRQVVRTERTDPTGHLGLAKALLAAGAPDEARRVLQGVIAGTWEARFGDVKKTAAELLARAEQDRNGGKR